jgi:hypothetical protein
MSDWWTIVLSGVFGAIFGTAITGLFTWRSIWEGYADEATKLALEVDQLFVSRPELRPYFYDGREAPVDGSIENSPLLAVREYVADCLEGIWDTAQVCNDDDWKAWLKYILRMLDSQKSPTLHSFVENEGEAWYPSLAHAREINPDTYRRPHFRRWRAFWQAV